MQGLKVRRNEAALVDLERSEIVELVEQATRSTFYTDAMNAEQIEANARIPPISGPAFLEAAACGHRHLAAAFAADRLVGFMIATRHGPDDHELDWLMVHPDRHGSGLAGALMAEGLDWLGADRPIWLTVLRHNMRAIRFYRRFGFEVDPAARLDRPVPSWIMRRRGQPNKLRTCGSPPTSMP